MSGRGTLEEKLSSPCEERASVHITGTRHTTLPGMDRPDQHMPSGGERERRNPYRNLPSLMTPFDLILME